MTLEKSELCIGCVFEKTYYWEEPCKRCSRCYPDRYREKIVKSEEKENAGSGDSQRILGKSEYEDAGGVGGRMMGNLVFKDLKTGMVFTTTGNMDVTDCIEGIAKSLESTFDPLTDAMLELSVQVNAARNSMLSLMWGRKVTNNWLKLHGGVMSRNQGRRKRK